MAPNPRIERWREDIQLIGSEVQGLHFRRAVFRRVGEISDRAALPPSVFFTYVNETYASTQASGVRRQADRRTDAVSLWRLLTEISAKPEVLTREWHREMYGDEFEPTERAAWELYADDGDTHIDLKLVKRDLAALEAAAKKAKDWTDAHIAHAGRERLDVTLTHGELDSAIDALGALMRRYDLLLRAASWAALVPEGIKLDLETLFGQPWVRP